MTRARLLLGLAFLVIFGSMVPQCVRAHDQYGDWKQPDTGQSCCNERKEHDGHVTGDCRPTAAWQDGEGIWWVRANGQNISVPPNKILPRRPDGRCHICEMHGIVFCFAPCDVRS